MLISVALAVKVLLYLCQKKEKKRKRVDANKGSGCWKV
jgi:hypothetical protein